MNTLLFQIKLIIRKFISRPLYPSVSFIGLILGFTACLLVSIWIKYELSYDKYHTNADRTYRVTVEIDNKVTGFHWDFARSSFNWLKHMPEEIPGIESMTRLGHWMEGIVRYKENMGPEKIIPADPNIFSIFNIDLIVGNKETCLSEARQVILSESIVKKYFGSENPSML